MGAVRRADCRRIQPFVHLHAVFVTWNHTAVKTQKRYGRISVQLSACMGGYLGDKEELINF